METEQGQGQGERSVAGRVQIVVSGVLAIHLPSKAQSVYAVKNGDEDARESLSNGLDLRRGKKYPRPRDLYTAWSGCVWPGRGGKRGRSGMTDRDWT